MRRQPVTDFAPLMGASLLIALLGLLPAASAVAEESASVTPNPSVPESVSALPPVPEAPEGHSKDLPPVRSGKTVVTTPLTPKSTAVQPAVAASTPSTVSSPTRSPAEQPVSTRVYRRSRAAIPEVVPEPTAEPPEQPFEALIGPSHPAPAVTPVTASEDLPLSAVQPQAAAEPAPVEGAVTFFRVLGSLILVLGLAVVALRVWLPRWMAMNGRAAQTPTPETTDAAGSVPASAPLVPVPKPAAWLSRLAPGLPADSLSVVSHTRLGRGQTLHLVKAMDRYLLVSSTPFAVQLVADLGPNIHQGEPVDEEAWCDNTAHAVPLTALPADTDPVPSSPPALPAKAPGRATLPEVGKPATQPFQSLLKRYAPPTPEDGPVVILPDYDDEHPG